MNDLNLNSIRTQLQNIGIYTILIYHLPILSKDIMIKIRSIFINQLINDYQYLLICNIQSSIYFRDTIWKETPYQKLEKLDRKIDKIKKNLQI